RLFVLCLSGVRQSLLCLARVVLRGLGGLVVEHPDVLQFWQSPGATYAATQGLLFIVTWSAARGPLRLSLSSCARPFRGLALDRGRLTIRVQRIDDLAVPERALSDPRRPGRDRLMQ